MGSMTAGDGDSQEETEIDGDPLLVRNDTAAAVDRATAAAMPKFDMKSCSQLLGLPLSHSYSWFECSETSESVTLANADAAFNISNIGWAGRKRTR